MYQGQIQWFDTKLNNRLEKRCPFARSSTGITCIKKS
jgi:hypothetical protein